MPVEAHFQSQSGAALSRFANQEVFWEPLLGATLPFLEEAVEAAAAFPLFISNGLESVS